MGRSKQNGIEWQGVLGTTSGALTRMHAPQSMGEEAASSGLGVSEFSEQHRDTHDFARRVGRLPEQRAGDRVDYRPLLHRDGSVLSAVTLEVSGSAAHVA